MYNFPNKKYAIIYADPPWRYKNADNLAKISILDGKIDKAYSTMSLDDLKKLPVENIADDNSLLFMWAISPDLPMCIELMQDWGFKYSTVAFVWDKQRINPGYYTCSQVEIVLVGKRGKIPSPRGSRKVRQYLSLCKTVHSKKPDEIRKRIEEMFPTQQKIELFARNTYVNWDCWGNEIEKGI